MSRPSFRIGAEAVAPGARAVVDLPIAMLSNHTPVVLSVMVAHGARPGPTLFVSAALHGDEVLGVETIRRLVRLDVLDDLAGTLLAVPVVNAFGFLSLSRYLPDRRDLNRSFPGRPDGSLAARLAHLFMSEVVARSDFGLDLHTGAVHRTNLPQLRVAETSAEVLCARRGLRAARDPARAPARGLAARRGRGPRPLRAGLRGGRGAALRRARRARGACGAPWA